MCFSSPKIQRIVQQTAPQEAPEAPAPVVLPPPPQMASAPPEVLKQKRARTKAGLRKRLAGGVTGKSSLTIPLSVPPSVGVNA